MDIYSTTHPQRESLAVKIVKIGDDIYPQIYPVTYSEQT